MRINDNKGKISELIKCKTVPFGNQMRYFKIPLYRNFVWDDENYLAFL